MAKPTPSNNWPKAQMTHSHSIGYHPKLWPQYDYGIKSYQQNNKNQIYWETTNQVLVQILAADWITIEELTGNASTKPMLCNSRSSTIQHNNNRPFQVTPPATLTDTSGYLQHWPSSRIWHGTGGNIGLASLRNHRQDMLQTKAPKTSPSWSLVTIQ